MAGRGKGRGGNAGRGDTNNKSGGRGGRGGNQRSRPTKVGLNKELEGNIFDLGERSSADLMRTTQIKIAQYVGSQYGGDIMGELETKQEFVAPVPEYPATAKARQPVYKSMVWATQANTLSKLQKHKQRLQAEIDAIPINPPEPEKLDELEEKMFDIDNEILQTTYKQGVDIKVPLDNEEKGEWQLSEKAYGDRVNKHSLNRQKAFAIIIRQCTQL
jgi:hypothetical protein